jgi:hypothetical protein
MTRVRSRICTLALLVSAWLFVRTVAVAQELTVIPLSPTSATSNYAISPQLDGVTFVGSSNHETSFLVVIDGDMANASQLTLDAEGCSIVRRESSYALAKPIMKQRDGEFSVTFVAIPVENLGSPDEAIAVQQWAADNSAWSIGRFGFGWQEALGEWVAINVVAPLGGTEALASASDTTLVVGTVGAAVIIVAGGEIVLGVGTLGGGGAVAAGGGAAAGGGGGVIVTGIGMSQNAIARAFFTGQTLANNPTNVAALTWYLQVAQNVLIRYQQQNYTGSGVATQTARIQQIQQQLQNWGH